MLFITTGTFQGLVQAAANDVSHAFHYLHAESTYASEEIDNLQKQINQLTASRQKATNPNLQLTASDFRITEYSDTLVARIIERIEVISAVRIKIEFIGGYTVTVPLQS